MTPGIFESHTSGRPQPISRVIATIASAPPYWRPSASRKRSSRINSDRDKPNRTPTRGSCSVAVARPRRSRMGATQRAHCVQKPHSASKNSQPRACRPLLSVYSLAREIIVRPASQPAFFFSFPSSVMTLPRSLPTPFNALTGMRSTSSHSPVMVVRNSSMLSRRSRV
jgi:hypothetical protein